jgi:glycosyltransferase involved in cell wall biosynthesis
MHQYTADLANRMVRAGHEVHLVTTSGYPADRYLPAITVHTPITTRTTGFSPEGLRWQPLAAVRASLARLKPHVVHFTGPHLWNLPLLGWCRRQGLPLVHSLHDLDPHPGTAYGRLLYGWNWLVIRQADHLLVHGRCYLDRLLARGLPPARITHVPLLHLFLGHTWLETLEQLAGQVTYEPWALFFGRLEHYKGVDHLITASAMLDGQLGAGTAPQLVLAGPGSLADRWAGALPPRIEVRDHLIGDQEAVELFRRCGLLVLPYLDATQSALVPAAYFFRKPVIVSRAGALPEYVEPGHTGWLVEPDHPPSLARCLQTALADPARLAQMGEAGRTWYDQQRAGEQRALERMYARLAETGPQNRRWLWHAEGLQQ